MKKLFLLAVAVCFATASFAQKGKLNAAKSAYKTGDYKAAYNAIEAASKHDKTKDLPETWVYKAQILSMLKMSPAVTQLMGIEVSDEDLSYSLERAAELANGGYKEELAEAAEVIINNTHNAGVTAFNGDKDYQKAVELFSQKVSLRETYMPDAEVDPLDYLIIGAAQFELDNTVEGVKNYEKLIELDYDDQGVYNTVLNYYEDQGDNEMYLTTLKKAQEKYPEVDNYKLLEIDYYINNGQIEEILSDMISTAESNPENVNLLVSIASAYNKKEDVENERMWLKKALEVDSFDSKANIRLGISYFNEAVAFNNTMNFEMSNTSETYLNAKKQRDELAGKALPLIEKAYNLTPEEPVVLQAMVQYYRMYGKKDMQAKYQAELDALD